MDSAVAIEEDEAPPRGPPSLSAVMKYTNPVAESPHAEDEFDLVLKFIRSLVARKQDVPILMTGEEGAGKSTLAWILGRILDQGFGPDRMILAGREFLQATKGLKPGNVLVWDEAIDGGFARQSGSGDNIDIQKWFVKARARRLVLIVVIPDRELLDKMLRERRSKIRFHVVRPGFAIFMIPVKRPDGKRTWRGLFAFRYPKVTEPAFKEYEGRKDKAIDEATEPREKKKDLVRCQGTAYRNDKPRACRVMVSKRVGYCRNHLHQADQGVKNGG
jgi:energy-coupling factor transporter ATP-binding protein EcfA2